MLCAQSVAHPGPLEHVTVIAGANATDDEHPAAALLAPSGRSHTPKEKLTGRGKGMGVARARSGALENNRAGRASRAVCEAGISWW